MSTHAKETLTTSTGGLSSVMALILMLEEHKMLKSSPDSAIPSPSMVTFYWEKKGWGGKLGKDRNGTHEFWQGTIQPNLRLTSPNPDLVDGAKGEKTRTM